MGRPKRIPQPGTVPITDPYLQYKIMGKNEMYDAHTAYLKDPKTVDMVAKFVENKLPRILIVAILKAIREG